MFLSKLSLVSFILLIIRFIIFQGLIWLLFYNAEIDNFGIIIVQIAGVNGGICVRDFGEAEVNVTCRMQGYDRGMGFTNGELGSVNPDYPMWYNEIQCQGNEATLADCQFGEDKGVQCPRELGTSVFCYNLDDISCKYI